MNGLKNKYLFLAGLLAFTICCTNDEEPSYSANDSVV